MTNTARILRDHRRRDMLASIAEWERASGTDRTYWRRDAQHRLREWRRLHAHPERAAFQQAVANSVIPCHRRDRCNWPACPQDCDGRPGLCKDCGRYPSDPPSKLCPACEAYREHQAADYRFTADLLRKYALGPAQDTALFRAVCVHNLNIILAALAHAEAVAPQEEAEP